MLKKVIFLVLFKVFEISTTCVNSYTTIYVKPNARLRACIIVEIGDEVSLSRFIFIFLIFIN